MPDEKFKQEQIDKEYLNFDKYEKNKVRVEDNYDRENDDGTMHSYRKFRKVMRALDVPESQQYHEEEISAFREGLQKKNPNEFLTKYLVEKEKITMSDPWAKNVQDEDPVTRSFHKYSYAWEISEGRVSPWCKEQIYRDYHLGSSIRDLSLKNGLLPERIRAIIWQREYFWKEVYPKIGETGLRMGLELEYQYSDEYPFVDYGKDLNWMSDREKGVEIREVERSMIDREVYPEMEHEFNNRLKKVKPKMYDLVPLKRYGSGDHSYMLYEKINHRGKNSRTVSKMFKRAIQQVNRPHLLPDVVQRHLKYGPRIASWQYKKL